MSRWECVDCDQPIALPTLDPFRCEACRENVNKDRGFAVMNWKRQREIASMGGKAAHAKGTAHKWTTETAKLAGQIGQANLQAKRKAVQS